MRPKFGGDEGVLRRARRRDAVVPRLELLVRVGALLVLGAHPRLDQWIRTADASFEAHEKGREPAVVQREARLVGDELGVQLRARRALGLVRELLEVREQRLGQLPHHVTRLERRAQRFRRRLFAEGACRRQLVAAGHRAEQCGAEGFVHADGGEPRRERPVGSERRRGW